MVSDDEQAHKPERPQATTERSSGGNGAAAGAAGAGGSGAAGAGGSGVAGAGGSGAAGAGGSGAAGAGGSGAAGAGGSGAAGSGAGDEHDELPETIRSRLERLVPELVKKTFAAGLGAVFSTEEGIRKIARESLPEVAGYIASSADGAKDKVFDVIARETREFLASLNVSEEIAKILTTLSFEIKTEIRFIPNSERFVGAEPEVKASVRLKRNDEAKSEAKPDRKDDRKEDRKDDRKDDETRSRLRFWHRDRDGGEPDDDEPDK